VERQRGGARGERAVSRIDVVVPCYNYARFLPRCVESLLSQEGVDVRVLVIDDASSDATPEVGRALAAAHPRVEFRRHETNQGHIATYNEGLLGWATSEYSLLLSADDVAAPGAFRRAVGLMDAHPGMGMAYGRALVIEDDSDLPALPAGAPVESRVLSGADFIAHCCEGAYCPVSTPTAIVRTAAQQDRGGYSADLPHSADLEMWLRFAVRGPIGVLRNVQAFYRWHQANMGAAYYNQVLGDRREFMVAVERVIVGHAGRFPDARRWLDAVHARVAIQAARSANKSFDAGDDEACRAWQSLAREVWPGIVGTPLWWRSRVKQWLGRPLLGRVRRVTYRLRGLPAPVAAEPVTHFRGFRPGDHVGWWPGSD
jgi:glycosyltransferase involved in cell wall biosynthesis